MERHEALPAIRDEVTDLRDRDEEEMRRHVGDTELNRLDESTESTDPVEPQRRCWGLKSSYKILNITVTVLRAVDYFDPTVRTKIVEFVKTGIEYILEVF